VALFYSLQEVSRRPDPFREYTAKDLRKDPHVGFLHQGVRPIAFKTIFDYRSEEEHPPATWPNTMRIRKLKSEDYPWVEAIVTRHFGSPRVVSRQVLHDVRELPGLIAELSGKREGLLQYDIQRDQCEIVVLIAVLQRHGIGRRLLQAAREMAHDRHIERVWLITTNNNHDAMEFFKAVGGRKVAVHEGAVREARKIKPEIPEYDENGTPIEHEIEFEFEVDHTK
jgi:N-acetylglutamate synthase-like GNAT family acetyltransferase